MGLRRTLNSGWSVWLDAATHWRDTPLDQLDRWGEHAPSGGWNLLDAGVPIDLPATTLDVDPEHRGVSWWSTELDLATGGPLVLRFEGVRLLCEVFWNRRRVALDLEGYTPFEVRLPAATAGRHRLDLRVTNPGGIHSWDDVRPVEWGRFQLPSSHDFGGPWQPVSLHENAFPRIADVWVRPNRTLDAALIDVEIEAAKAEPLHVDLIDPDGAIAARHTTMALPGRTHMSIRVDNPLLYGPGYPNVYRCRVKLGEDLDSMDRKFGFRLLDYVDGDLRLNGESFRMSSAISWGWYRRGPVPSAGDVKREAASVASFGMNTLTAHRFPSTTALQDALETRGLLLYQEPGGIGGPLFVPTFRADQRAFALQLMARRVRRLARRDRSSAALVWWNLANEWNSARMASWPDCVRTLPQVLREQDDSRLTTFTSGWGKTPMWRPHDAEQHTSWDYHRVFAWPDVWTDAVEWEVDVARPPEPMLAIDGESACFASIGRLGEFTASLPDDLRPGSPAAHFRRWVENIETDLRGADPAGLLGGLDGLTAGTAAVQAHSVARLIEAHRRQPWLHGVALNGWHQHHKVGNSGLVALDRTPLCDPMPIRRANAPTVLAFSELPRVMQRGMAHEIRVELLSNRAPQPATAELIVSQAGEVLWRGNAPCSFVPEHSGIMQIEARNADLCVTDQILIVAPPRVAGLELAIVDPHRELTDWLAGEGVRVRQWRFHEAGPILVVAQRSGAIREYLAAAPSGRLALLDGRKAFGSMPLTFEGPGFEQMPAAPGSTAPMRGAYIGGWSFSLSNRELPNLGAVGVWGAERGTLFAPQGLLQPTGRWITGFCTFPDADAFDVRMPRLAATTWISERGAGRETLHTYLPLAERRDHPLGRAVLLDLVRWLAAH